jgi:hypothetical protein
MKQAQPLDEIVKELPTELQVEVRDFAQFLLEKHVRKPKGKPKFDWAGALKDLPYTSVELQHKISEWRVEEQ